MALKKLASALAIALGTVGVAAGAQAITVVTYTNLADWQAAVTNDILQDFNAEAEGAFNNRDFGDFTATRTNTNVGMNIRGGGFFGDINGTRFLELNNGAPIESMIWTFDFGIRALAFDWRNTDITNDVGELIIGGQQIATFPSQQSGFFGITTDMPFTQALLSNTPGGGGVLSYLSLDNVRYAAAVAVPEPATLALFGLGLAGLGFAAQRRRKVG